MMAGGGRGRGTRGGMIARRADGLGAPAGPEAMIDSSRRRSASGSGCSSARPGGVAARRRRDSHTRASDLSDPYQYQKQFM